MRKRQPLIAVPGIREKIFGKFSGILPVVAVMAKRTARRDCSDRAFCLEVLSRQPPHAKLCLFRLL